MNRFLAALMPRTTESDDGCCPECTPACTSRKLRAESRDRALRFRAGL